MASVRDTDIARGYAESLLGLARVEGMEERLEDELFDLMRAIEKSYELREFLKNRDLKAEAKKKALDELLANETSSLLRGELNILIDLNRTDLIADVAQAYIDLMKTEKNRLLAEVVTAVAMTDDVKKRVAAKLSEVTGKNVSVKNTVDKDVIGGMVVKVEGRIVDLSVKKKLTDLQRGIKAAG